MGKITVEECVVDGMVIEGLKVITPQVFGDNRGYFMETYNYNDFKEAGIDQVFVQDNQSSSKKGVLRGLHFQKEFPQDKLVRVVRGEVYDAVVDLREGSKTYGKWPTPPKPQKRVGLGSSIFSVRVEGLEVFSNMAALITFKDLLISDLNGRQTHL